MVARTSHDPGPAQATPRLIEEAVRAPDADQIRRTSGLALCNGLKVLVIREEGP